MVLIDFGHLSSRILFTAVGMIKPKIDNKTKKYITSEWIDMYIHLLFKNLAYLKMKFEQNYGELIICVDSRNSWRKKIYSNYKENRKKTRNDSPVNFEEFYEYQNDIIKELLNNFPFKVIEVSEAEADDIIGVLSKAYGKIEKTVVISSDKDFKQVLEYGVKLFDPIAKIFINMSEKELKEWKIEHILIGDKADNIPNIKEHTEFSDEFKSYLNDNGVYKNISVKEFNNLSISKELIEKYDVYDTFKSGKRKGEKKDEKLIYKKIMFGEKAVYKFAKNLKENLKKHPLYIENFKRNQQLILFDNIPDDIREKILKAYKTTKININVSGIMSFFSKYHQIELLKTASDFFQTHYSKNEFNSEWE